MTSPVLTPVSITHLKFFTFSDNRQDAGMLGTKLSPGFRIFPALKACSYKMQIEPRGKYKSEKKTLNNFCCCTYVSLHRWYFGISKCVSPVSKNIAKNILFLFNKHDVKAEKYDACKHFPSMQRWLIFRLVHVGIDL